MVLVPEATCEKGRPKGKGAFALICTYMCMNIYRKGISSTLSVPCSRCRVHVLSSHIHALSNI